MKTQPNIYDLNSFRENQSIPITPESLPYAYRVTKFEYVNERPGFTKCISEIFHDEASLRVEWINSKVDEDIKVGSLVSIRWHGGIPKSNNGSIMISRLVCLHHPEANIQLFKTIPYQWLKDRKIIDDIAEAIDTLPTDLKLLINTIFWDEKRLYRFITGPSSVNGHHHRYNGNIRHTSEVINLVRNTAEISNSACKSVLIVAGLLHDAGKADEYELNVERGVFELSDRGVLIGHKITIIEWIAAARVNSKIKIEESHYIGLIHALTSVSGAPAWVGVRESKTLEAMFLATADRISVTNDLHKQSFKNNKIGFGNYHSHLKGKPYKT